MKKMIAAYKELMEEINSEVTEGLLAPGDTLQILRQKTPAFEGYCPITDWYYDEYTMKQELETPLEEMYMPEEFTKEEWAEMKADQEAYKKQYESEKADLVPMKVKDVLTEMKQMQKLFGK